MDKRLEFWDKRNNEAQTALQVAQAHLLRIQAVGQMSLFSEQKPDPLAERRGEVIQFPRREIIPYPPRPPLDDLIA